MSWFLWQLNTSAFGGHPPARTSPLGGWRCRAEVESSARRTTLRLTIAAILTVVGLAAVHAETGFVDRAVVLTGQTFRYTVYVPADYTPARTWPVIVALHGDGAQGDDGLLPTARGLADQIRLRRRDFPAIVVFPQAPPGARFMYPLAMQEMVIAQLDRTIEEFNGDRQRVYLVGYSMGAGGVYRIAYRWPERFAALVSIAGPVVPPSIAPPTAVALDAGLNSFASNADPFVALAKGIVRIPVWLVHGARDQTISVEQSRRLVAALRSAGASPHYRELADADHTSAAVQGYADPMLITWLLQQRRP
jgi:predicted peptidase